MFSKEDGITDPFPDKAGKLARKIYPRTGWTAKAAEKRGELVGLLESYGYISFDASVKNYGVWSVGESMLFYVPVERRGALSVFHEQFVRLVCVRTGRYTRGLMAGPIEAPTELRAKLLKKLTKNQSVRMATNQACAPFLTRYLKSLGIRGTNRSDGFTFLAAREDSSMSSAWTCILALEHIKGLSFRLHQGQLEILGSAYELLDSESMYDDADEIIVPRRYKGVRVVGLEDNEFLKINKFYSEDASDEFNSMETQIWRTFFEKHRWFESRDSESAVLKMFKQIKKFG